MSRDRKSVTYTIEQINEQYGKLPPQAIDVEEAVLGALILEEDAYDKVNDIIKVKSFYKEEHQKLFAAVEGVREKGNKVDLLMVTMYLKDHEELDEIGGPGYIIELTRRVASAAHIEQHARIIQQKFLQREIIRISSESQTRAYDDTIDIKDLLEYLVAEYNELEHVPENTIHDANNAMDQVMDGIRVNYESDGKLTGITWGLNALDLFTNGIQMSDLDIIAGEPSMGKTSFATSVLNGCTKSDEPGGIISLEMTTRQVMAKVVAQETRISSKAILNFKLTDEQIRLIDQVKASITSRKLYIDPECGSDLVAITSSIRFMHKNYNVRVFFIDYLQLITVPDFRGTSEAMIGHICRSLKNIAKELEIAIILLSQLNRDEKKRRPTMNRLRGSGQIEEAADNIIFIHRPEYHNVEFFEDGESTENKAELIFAKGRNTGVDEFIVNFQKHTGRFYEGQIVDEFDQHPDLFNDSDAEKEEPF